MKFDLTEFLMRFNVVMMLCILLVGCLGDAERAEIEARLARLQAKTEALTEGIRSGKIPVEEGLALIAVVGEEIKATQKDLTDLANKPWYTKLDAVFTLVLGLGNVLGIPTAWIQRARAIRNSKVAESVIRGVEAFTKKRDDDGGDIKEVIATTMANMGVSDAGYKAVKAATE
jgi:hypothetical protein